MLISNLGIWEWGQSTTHGWVVKRPIKLTYPDTQIACKQAPGKDRKKRSTKLTSAKKKKKSAIRARWGETRQESAWLDVLLILLFNWYQNLVSWSDWFNQWLLTALRYIYITFLADMWGYMTTRVHDICALAVIFLFLISPPFVASHVILKGNLCCLNWRGILSRVELLTVL